MKYGRLKIEEAISLKMVMYGGFHGPVAWVNEMFYEDRSLRYRGSARAARADLIRGHTRALDEVTGC